jgi:hypothetical protein
MLGHCSGFNTSCGFHEHRIGIGGIEFFFAVLIQLFLNLF